MSVDSKKAKEIFGEAVLLKTAARPAFVMRTCDGDPDLRQEVEELLAAIDSAGDFIENPAVTETKIKSFKPTPIGQSIGPYKIREQIGEGGFGIVYVAQQYEPIHRRVALKIIKPGMDSKSIIARFEAERQALALMAHPNIARVLDAGATDKSHPYFVMELVQGVPITEFCDKEKLTTCERLKLYIDVCRALQHAHQKGIIHRDIKPTNVLVTLHDGKPVPKVIDFGVAKALSQKLTERTIYTSMGQMVGTPMYMSPEQAELSGLDVDTRSDVYSLGVLLYELLTGATPFGKEKFKQVGYDELRRIIRENEPAKPSVRLSTLNNELLDTISDQRKVDSHRLLQSLKGELDWIVMKALEKDRDRRYATPAELADDIERFLADAPVQACPPSVTYRAKKYAQRHKAVLTTTILVGLSLLIGTAVSLWQLQEANNALDLADGRLKLLLAEREKLGAQQQTLIAAQKELAATYDQLAYSLYVDKGDYKQAASLFRQTIRYKDKLCEVLLGDPKQRRDAIHPRNGLGWSLYKSQRHAEAEEVFREAVSIIEELSQKDPQLVLSPGGPRWIFQCYMGLRNCLLESGKFDEADESFRRGLPVIDREFQKQDRPAFAEDFEYCSRHLTNGETVRDAPRALRYATRAVELDGDNPANWRTLGIAQYYNDQFTKSVESLKIAEQFDESREYSHWITLYLGLSYWQLGELRFAREWIEAASDYCGSEGISDSFLAAYDEANQLMKIDDWAVTTNAESAEKNSDKQNNK